VEEENGSQRLLPRANGWRFGHEITDLPSAQVQVLAAH
jgi:hypothetical protein